jgi:ABC-type lipoprotein release transport system permease subunit
MVEDEMQRHARILEFALSSLFRKKFKNLAIVLAFSYNVFLIASLLFLTEALNKEAGELLKGTPEVIIQKVKGGRHELIPVEYAHEIGKIRGVRKVAPRWWGYYYDTATKANYTFMGVEQMIPEVGKMVDGNFCHIFSRDTEKLGSLRPCVVGQGVADARFIGVDDIIPVSGSDGKVYVLKVVGVFKSDSVILTNDLVILQTENLREIFDMPENMATDLVARIRNPKEIDTVTRKIQTKLPAVRIMTKRQILSTYQAMFGWRSGLMVALIIGSISAFAILAWDKASGLSAGERKEIGALKAVGWETSEVLELKFWEGFVISSISFLSGVIAADVHVFFFGGALFSPVLKGWSVLFPEFRPIPHLDPYHFLTIMLLTVVPYTMATIIPSWKAAITDPDMAVK